MGNELNSEYLGKYREIINGLYDFIPVDDDDELGDPLKSNEENKRDAIITKILRSYYQKFESKRRTNEKYKKILIAFSFFVFLFVAILICLIFWSIKDKTTDVIDLIAPIILSFITLLATIIMENKVITTYVFSQNEDDNMAKIIQIIVENDIESKKINSDFQKNQPRSKKIFTEIENDETSNQ